MAVPVITKQLMKTTVTGELRKGFCMNCGTRTEKIFYMDGDRKRVKAACPVCGGLGELIVRTYSIQPPEQPKNISFKELYRFVLRVLYSDWLSKYHTKRVKYAQKHKNILDKYRTGEPSPETIKECIKEIIKLKLRR